MNHVISDLDDCECYIDDVVIYSDTFEQHMKQIHQFVERGVSMANLTVNLVKSEFCHATVEYLGYIVGQGKIKPVKAKVEAIVSFSCT